MSREHAGGIMWWTGRTSRDLGREYKCRICGKRYWSAWGWYWRHAKKHLDTGILLKGGEFGQWHQWRKGDDPVELTGFLEVEPGKPIGRALRNLKAGEEGPIKPMGMLRHIMPLTSR